jgi:hypothetical protein
MRSRLLLLAVALLCAGSAAIAAPGAAARAGGAKATARGTITRSAHTAFETCNARQIVLTVSVPTHPFTPSQPVRYTVRLRNTGSTTCGTALARGGTQIQQPFTVGPCSPVPVIVYNAEAVDVYPAHLAFDCPLETGFVLAPHSTARTTTSWNQAAYVGPRSTPEHAPPGRYHLEVDGAVGVPFTLTTNPARG